MKLIRRFTLVVVLFIVLFSGYFTETVIAEDQDILSGVIVNGTPENLPPDGIQIVLSYVTANDFFGQISTITDINGVFTFKDLPTMPIEMLIVETTYLDVPYALRVDPANMFEPITITVFEETSSPSVLKVIDNSVVVMGKGSSPNTINVLEAVHLENESNLIYVSKPETANPMDLLRFSLPEEIESLEVETELIGGHILQVDKGFALTTPIPPGKHNILFTYVAHYKGEDWEFVHSFPFGSQVFRFLIKESFKYPDGSKLSDLGLVAIGGLNYNVLEIENVNAGEKISLKLEQLPTPSVWQKFSSIVLSKTFKIVIIPAVAMIILSMLFVYSINRRDRRLSP